MSTAKIQPLPQYSTSQQKKRDDVVDLARAACLLVVVLFHGLMMGVQQGALGWQVTNAFEGQGFFAVLSLFLQVMPLFFILGGFSSYGAWQRRRAAGISAASFCPGTAIAAGEALVHCVRGSRSEPGTAGAFGGPTGFAEPDRVQNFAAYVVSGCIPGLLGGGAVDGGGSSPSQMANRIRFTDRGAGG